MESYLPYLWEILKGVMMTAAAVIVLAIVDIVRRNNQQKVAEIVRRKEELERQAAAAALRRDERAWASGGIVGSTAIPAHIQEEQTRRVQQECQHDRWLNEYGTWNGVRILTRRFCMDCGKEETALSVGEPEKKKIRVIHVKGKTTEG